MTAKKFDRDKAPLDYLRLDGVAEMCEVFEFGAKKYGKNNYLEGLAQSRLLAAALRHILAYQQGEDRDPESGKSHIAHAQCCLAMIKSQIAVGSSIDDRSGETSRPKYEFATEEDLCLKTMPSIIVTEVRK